MALFWTSWSDPCVSAASHPSEVPEAQGWGTYGDASPKAKESCCIWTLLLPRKRLDPQWPLWILRVTYSTFGCVALDHWPSGPKL